MPAKSSSQRRLFGMVLAAKRNQLKNPPAKIEKVAEGVTETQAEDFARKKNRQGVVSSLMKKGDQA